MTTQEFVRYTESTTPLCNAEIDRLRKHYDPLTLQNLFCFARKLEVQLAIANNTIVNLHNQLEALEEKAQK